MDMLAAGTAAAHDTTTDTRRTEMADASDASNGTDSGGGGGGSGGNSSGSGSGSSSRPQNYDSHAFQYVRTLIIPISFPSLAHRLYPLP